jgi:hypothetical protein
MILFMALALVGFGASLLVHMSSWGHEPLSINQTWPLHVGIFVVFIPAVLGQRRNPNRAAARDRKAPQYPLAPPWMNKVLNICGLYTVVNFLLFIVLLMAFTPNVRERDGRYVIEKGHEVVRPATDEEVRTYHARIARGFSGHWMIFYWAALVGLIDGRRRREIEAAEHLQQRRSAARSAHLPRQYMGSPPMLGLWGHTVLIFAVAFILFFGFPLAEAVFFMSRHHDGVGFVLFIPAALLGLFLAPRLVRKIPARCPICDGRAYYIGGTLGSSSQPRPYRCADCGAVIDQSQTE